MEGVVRTYLQSETWQCTDVVLPQSRLRDAVGDRESPVVELELPERNLHYDEVVLTYQHLALSWLHVVLVPVHDYTYLRNARWTRDYYLNEDNTFKWKIFTACYVLILFIVELVAE